MGQLVAQDLARRYVVAVGETAGNCQDLVPVQELGLLAQAVDVQAIRHGSRLFEGELRLPIAVSSGGTKNQGPWFGHVMRCNRNRNS